MKYIDYNLTQDFYSIDEACRQLEISKAELRAYSEKFGIDPVEDPYSGWGLTRWQFCNLHNHIYKAQREQAWNGPVFQNRSRGPWA